MGNCFVSKPSSRDNSTTKEKVVDHNELKVDLQEVQEEQQKQQVVKEEKQVAVNSAKTQEEPQEPKQEAQDKSADKYIDKSADKSQINQNNVSQDDSAKPDPEDKKKKRNKVKAKKVRADIEEESQIYENIIKREREMTNADIHANKKSLGNHFVFSLLSDQDKEEIIKKMFYCENKSDFVFKQGDQASTYFIIEKGECQIIINGDVKRTLQHGQCFGELALLYGAPRSASVKALGVCGFWAIDRNTFKKAIAEVVHREYGENRSFIDKIKFFNSMTNEQKDSIANVLITQVFKKGEIIVADGDMASSYYIIKKGKVAIYKDEKMIREMVAGETFGEQALFENSKRGATVKAVEDDSRCIALGKDDIQRVLGDKVQVIMYNNMIKWAFEGNEILKKLTKVQKEKIVINQKQTNYQKGVICFPAGQPVQKLIFLLEGSIAYEGGNKIAEKGGLFGDHWLLQKYKDEKLSKNVIFSEDTLLAEISFQQLYEQIGGKNIEEIIDKNKDSHEVKYMKRANSKDLNKEYEHLKLEDMISIKKLGFGQFGSVYLVKSKSDSNYYALKCISKAQVIEQSLEKHLLQEKKVLESAQFPFIMKFIRTFRDNNNVYFLVEYVRGMELFDVIREIGLLNTYDSQFYIGSLLLCIEYLHTNSIIYRDIKPENIMIDYKGYMKLIDMGTAKFLKGKSGRTFTIIGTPHYMAPEIITGKGYSYSVDLWSIGICLYEFMCGAVPFAEDADDPYEIYEEIIKKPLQYPGFLKDKNSKTLMNQLLNKTPELRLGGSYAALKANPWFDNFDFDKLMERQLRAPYVPPKDKLISEAEIKKMEGIRKLVMDEIKHENTSRYRKENAKDPNWDKDF
ncbi:CGMP-dependent kinase 5-1 (macronuclear) [Tetrahymena thermophila SB210]|uniref:cGMP-dependent protein kinase n=1 Tax=Tetrahymena thermophila (strain SB210) TaxID=312017 RepID=I7MD55_TETTS|nr:CGMP-dependent kinase 5-1 [Tetrahymena thermophila SB210]EAR85527.2 CGMP-dependent kinase 5-1 [Tetrahymena thermophila SB210]|eukprot:XP_001033190.2 CGMP-dependent kinase 5-1 [Tetrahymena thermophila SB210]